MGVFNGDSIYNGLEAPEASFKASYNVSTGTHTSYNDILEAYNDGQNILLEVKWGSLDSSNDVSYCILNKIYEGGEIRFRGVIFRKDWIDDILILPTNVFQINEYYFNRPQPGQNGYVLTIGSNYNVMQWSKFYPYKSDSGELYLNSAIKEIPNGTCIAYRNVAGLPNINVKVICSNEDKECPFINIIINCLYDFVLDVSTNRPYAINKRIGDNYNLQSGKKYSLTVIGLVAYLDELA